jgi:acyl carrier protein
MNADEFYTRFQEFLAERRPDLSGAITPETELWVEGYLDSFGLIETLTLLEEWTGRTLEVGADDIASFSTMSAIYKAFVAQ